MMRKFWFLLVFIGCSHPVSSVAPLVSLMERYPTLESTYANALLADLAKTMKLEQPVSITILKADEHFALSADNGKIAISSGLIKSLPNEASFAFVIAHEIAHFKLDHFSGDEREEDADTLGLFSIYKAGFSVHHVSAVFAHGKINDSRRKNFTETLSKFPFDFIGIADRDVFQSFKLGL